MLKQDLYREIARNLDELTGEFVAGSGCSLNAFISSDLIFPEIDHLRGHEVFVPSAVGLAGIARVIASYGAATHGAFVAATLPVVPSTNTDFWVFKRFRTSDMRAAVDRAMGMARMFYLDTYAPVITLVATQYEYTVPSGMDFVGYLQLVPTSGSDYKATDDIKNVFELRQPFWRLEQNVITFDPRRISLSDLDKQPVKVIGQSRPAALGTNNSVVPSQLEEYLIMRSSQILASRRLGQGNEWTLINKQFTDMAENLELYLRTQARGDEVR